MSEYSKLRTTIECINNLKVILNDSYKDVRQKVIAQALILASGKAKKEFNDQYLFQQNKEIHAQEMAGLSIILEEMINKSKMSGTLKHPTEELEDRINSLNLPSKISKLPKGNIYVLTRLILSKLTDKNETYRKIGEIIEKTLFSEHSLSFYKPFRETINRFPKDNHKKIKLHIKTMNDKKKEELIKKQLLKEEELIRDALRNLL